MIDKRTFCKLMDNLGAYVGGMEELEKSLGVMFDDNFMTKIVDRTLITIAESFFTQQQIDDIEDIAVDTVTDILYHYAFEGQFGVRIDKLQRLYVEDEGLSTEFMLNAFNSSELYDVIDRYLNPPTVAKTYTINC